MPKLATITPEKSLSQEQLKAEVHYDPTSGLFYRKKDVTCVKLGMAVGWADKRGYLRGSILHRSYMMHRLAFLYMTGVYPDRNMEVDHIDHDCSNNAWDNLRLVSKKVNGFNQKKKSNNTSGFTGVSWDKAAKKWAAYIRVENKLKRLGYFVDKMDAVKARQSAEITYGFHANHGQ